MMRTLREILVALWRKYREDNVSILVSSLAYYTFFSFGPMLLLLASIIGFLFGMGEEFTRVPLELIQQLPFSSEYLTRALERIIHARRSLGLLGSGLLIWSATAAFDNLQQILNKIHQAPTMRPLWRRRLLGILLALVVMLFLPLSIAMSWIRPLLVRTLVQDTPLSSAWEPVLLTLSTAALGVTFNFILFLTLYLFGPSVRRRVGQIWPGALAGAILWEGSKFLFGVYIHSLSTYKMLYGSIGSIIAILLWLYISGMLFAIGAELNFVLAVRGRRQAPS